MSTPIDERERNQIKLQGFLEDKLKWHDYTHIAVDDPALAPAAHFVHTVGRARADRPELIVTGCADAGWGMDLISDVVACEAALGVLEDGMRLTADQARVPLLIKDVSTAFVRTKRVAQATSRFGAGIRIFQIVWPDAAGRFPTDAGYDQRGHPQQTLWDAVE